MASPSAGTSDLSSTTLVSSVILCLIGAFFAVTRLWVRFFKTQAHGWDDYFIAAALAASIALMGLTIAMVHNGYGKHIGSLSHEQITSALKFSNFAVLVNGVSMAFLKVSIGLSILRLQLGSRMRWIVWALIVLSVLVNALALVTTLFGCRPLAAVWDQSLLPTASCLPLTVNVVNSYVQTVGNIITDLVYSFGPLYYLSKVKVSVYNKWALRGVFMIGLLATVCSIAKCTELPKLKSTIDPTYDGARLTIWVWAEFNAGLIAAAIPPLKALFEDVLRKVFGVRSQTRSTSGYATRSLPTRRSRAHALEDDEIAMRSHAAYVHSNTKYHPNESGRESMDSYSVGTSPRHGAVDVDGRRSSREDVWDDRRGGQGQITKTVSYTVRENDSQ